MKVSGADRHRAAWSEIYRGIEIVEAMALVFLRMAGPSSMASALFEQTKKLVQARNVYGDILDAYVDEIVKPYKTPTVASKSKRLNAPSVVAHKTVRR